MEGERTMLNEKLKIVFLAAIIFFIVILLFQYKTIQIGAFNVSVESYGGLAESEY